MPVPMVADTTPALRTLVARTTGLAFLPNLLHGTEVGLIERRGVSAPPGGILPLGRRAEVAVILAPLPSTAPTGLMAMARLIKTAALHPWPIFMPAMAVLTTAAHEDPFVTALSTGSRGMSLIPALVATPALTLRGVLIPALVATPALTLRGVLISTLVATPALTLRGVLISTLVATPALTLRAILRPCLAIGPTGFAPPGFMTQPLIGVERLLFSREAKGCAAIAAFNFLILKRHVRPSMGVLQSCFGVSFIQSPASSRCVVQRVRES